MHAFNRLGMKWCSSSTALCTQVVKKEWGFVGQQETDAVATSEGYKAHFSTSLAAGTNTYCLDFSGASSKALVKEIQGNDDGYLLGKLRDSAHNYLYIIANSAVMNGYSTDSKVVSVTPWWQPAMYCAIAVFAILELLFLALLVRGKRKESVQVEEVQKS